MTPRLTLWSLVHIHIKQLNNINSFLIRNESVEISTSAKNVRVVLDETLSMNQHPNSETKNCCFHLFLISKIRQSCIEAAAAKKQITGGAE